MTDTEPSIVIRSRRRSPRFWARVALWVLGVPAVIILALYAKLLFGPMPVPFLRGPAQAAAAQALPPGLTLTLGDIALGMEGGLWPVVRFSPVRLRDSNSGADIKMDSLEIGFSPVRAMFGQPGLSVTMVRPHIQIMQDLFGPRLAAFELVDDADGNDATVWVLEGKKPLPSVRISSKGLDVRGALPQGGEAKFRSDNDWLRYNMRATEEGLAAFETQVRNGQFSRLRVKDGIVDMHDSVYGLFRRYTNVQFDVAPATLSDTIRGSFAARLAGRKIKGEFVRKRDENGDIVLNANTSDLDYATLLPFIDDPDGIIAIHGAGTLGISVRFSGDDGAVLGGGFDADLTGTRLRVQTDSFPVTTRHLHIDWNPRSAQFTVANAEIDVGESSATVSGVFVMGLDKTYGPTLSASVEAHDVVLHPNDMGAPTQPFAEIAFKGWSAPLYGALGIDQIVVQKPGVLLRAKGRVDFLTAGLGLDLRIGGHGASVDDLKRLWPYFLSPDARDWFVHHVQKGTVNTGEMKVDFPVGSISMTGEEPKPVPDGALSIDIVGDGVRFTPLDTVAPIDVIGKTRVKLRDNVTTVGIDGATVDAGKGPVSVKQAAFIIDTSDVTSTVFEISGNVAGDLPSVVALAREQRPEMLEALKDAPVDPDALTGEMNGSLVATIVTGENGQTRSVDYAANGTVSDFSSSKTIENYSIDDGKLTFAVSPSAGYSINGDAKVDGIAATLDINGKLGNAEPDILVSSDLDIAEMASLGFDASSFLSGKVRFAARPVADGLQVAADLKQASVNVADLGITKAAGIDGRLSAEIHQDGDVYNVSDVRLQFGSVDIRGTMAVTRDGLQSADFSTFKLSPGDDATLSVTPTDDGVSLKLRGAQLDLKPMLRRYFAIDRASTGGPQSTQFDRTISVDIQLKRAPGFYKTTGYNLDLDMTVEGSDLKNVSMQAQFAENSAVSVATNPTDGGRTMSVATNDAGTLLRYLNVYPRLLGGHGSLTLRHFDKQNIDRGELTLNDFSLVDEQKVAEVLGNHRDSRVLISDQNTLNFNAGQVHFVRRPDRIEVTDAVLDGDTTGGTLRGYVYTRERRYDLTGTYIPLFALNNIFQKIPIIGRILGGRDGEGLVGVTFAVRGKLDDPQFLVNPASILLPGVFRELMEFRAKEEPPAQTPAAAQTAPPDTAGAN